jgi:hypothetical protein
MKILFIIAIYLRLHQNSSILAKDLNYSQTYSIDSSINKRSNEYITKKNIENYVIYAKLGQKAKISCFLSFEMPSLVSNITLPNNSLIINHTNLTIEFVNKQNAGKYVCYNGERSQSFIIQIEETQHVKRLDPLLVSKSFCSLKTNESNFALKTLGKIYTAFSFCFYIISIIYVVKISIKLKKRQTKVNTNEIIDSQRSRIFKRRIGVLSASALQTKPKTIVEEVQTTRI